MEDREWVLNLVKLLFAGLGIGAVVYFLLIPVIRMLRNTPDIDSMIPDFDLVLDEEEEELQIPSGSERPERMEIIDGARKDPQATAMIISRWLRSQK